MELSELARAKNKPLVVWVGAGASSWAGLPSWASLAEQCFTEFLRKEPTFDSDRARSLLEAKRYPEFFGVCRKLSPQRYNRLIFASLQLPTETSAVYTRFLNALGQCGAPHVLTTNVDELLERGLSVPTVLPKNAEIIRDLINSKKPFVAKIHGTISDLTSIIFTDDDYRDLVANSAFREMVKAVFRDAVVLFIGYGLAEDHILKALTDAEGSAPIFGTGPHFVCATNDRTYPDPVRLIRYIPEPHKDHRSSIQVLEEISSPAESLVRPQPKISPKLTSAHMLADCTPAGTWMSSQRVEIVADTGEQRVFYHGHGLIQSELPFQFSTALHDLVVGLICFDRVYVPLTYLGRLHDLVGSACFNELIQADVLRFVRTKFSDVVIFEKKDGEITGVLGEISFPPLGADMKESSTFDQIMKEIRPSPGKEREAFTLFRQIEGMVLTPSTRAPITQTVKSLLLRPSVRSMLGMSHATKTSVVPKWLTFPILRLAAVARLGNVCRELQLGSVKFGVGNDKLAAPVFAASFGKEFAETVASYVVAGKFNADLGAFASANPMILNSILRFRDTPAGSNLRQSILDQLAGSGGADVAASINAGLNNVIGHQGMEAARGEFSKLYIAQDAALPAAWFDPRHSDRALGLWRNRAIAELAKVCSDLKLGPYDLCPCGSGDKLRFCCQEALSSASIN